MAPRIVDKKRKREKILRAALNVFARQGIGNFRMIDIAEKAHIGKGTIYEYFPSKDQLIVGAFNLIIQDYEQNFVGRTDNLSDPIEKIKTFFAVTCEFFGSRRERLDVMFDLWVAGIPRRGKKPLFDDMNKMYNYMKRWLAAIIDEGVAQGMFKPVESSFVASMIIAVLDGLLFQAVLGLIKLDARTIPEKLSRTLLEGILKQ